MRVLGSCVGNGNENFLGNKLIYILQNEITSSNVSSVKFIKKKKPKQGVMYALL